MHTSLITYLYNLIPIVVVPKCFFNVICPWWIKGLKHQHIYTSLVFKELILIRLLGFWLQVIGYGPAGI